jgi:uncharacterized protein
LYDLVKYYIMGRLVQFAAAIAGLVLLLSGCVDRKSSLKDYPIQPVPFTSVILTDEFWGPRIKKNAEITIPIAFGHCESTGRIRNFEIAGGLDTGKFQSLYPFDDSDVYKIIEGASYSLQTFSDPKIESYLDTLIWKIGLAQEVDGYLYTNRTIAEKNGGNGLHEWAAANRWELDSLHSHELYNIGHLYEAAVAHYQATGKRSLLDIALKSADLVVRDFGRDSTRIYPGHQGIEMGLVKLYRITGEKKYLDLARFFLDIRGPGGSEYNQAHIKPYDQTEASGHSVRATYMYSGMADIAAIEGDSAYLKAITEIWEDIVFRKMYVTGGIGATGGNEGFAGPYDLPNMSAYCETCASIGNIFVNHRLFLLHGQSEFIDIIEKTLYNAMLSGVSLTADRFFYPNPLESNGQHERSAWFGCACCPSNLARFLPAIPGYIYAVRDNSLYVNLFISGNAKIEIGQSNLEIVQKANFPWDGKVEISVNPELPSNFDLKIRIPGWARNEALPGGLYRFSNHNDEPVRISVNDESLEYTILQDGYILISREWTTGDKIEIDFPMPVRIVFADERISENKEKMAVQRGPLIFCAEWPDNSKDLSSLLFMKDTAFSTAFEPSLLGGIQVIRTTGFKTRRTPDRQIKITDKEQVVLIPYAYWNNRGPGKMKVWLPASVRTTQPLPANTLAFRSRVKASKLSDALASVNDQIVPSCSNDNSVLNFNWLPHKNRWEWIQYDLNEPEMISKTKVYWFDDGPQGGCRIPDDWEILYLDDNVWTPVKGKMPYKTTRDGWDSLAFDPVMASSVKIKVKLKRDFSAGIYEWIIE